MGQKNILFINGSPNKNGNTVKLAKELLAETKYTQLDLADYKLYSLGQKYDDDQFNEIYQAMKQADTIVMGTPVYWYTMTGSLKILFDRLYDYLYNNELRGKNLYALVQGTEPTKETISLARYTFGRFASLYNMQFMGIATNRNEALQLKLVK